MEIVTGRADSVTTRPNEVPSVSDLAARVPRRVPLSEIPRRSANGERRAARLLEPVVVLGLKDSEIEESKENIDEFCNAITANILTTTV